MWLLSGLRAGSISVINKTYLSNRGPGNQFLWASPIIEPAYFKSIEHPISLISQTIYCLISKTIFR